MDIGEFMSSIGSDGAKTTICLAWSAPARHQRGNNRQAAFYIDGDRRVYLEHLGAAARKYGCLIHAYVLMTNHVHLLATPLETAALSRTMQHLGRRYVRYLNDTYRRSGTLWEDRFKASLVDSELYFLQCCRYIELNPVRARIVSGPGDYQWSSYRCHALGTHDALVSAHEEYERLGSNPEARQAAYRALFNSEQSRIEVERIRTTVNQGWPLGGDRFRVEIEQALKRAARPPKRGRPLTNQASID
jgi:REP-associated tyrosine transposase